MKIMSFKELEVWKLAHRHVLNIYRISSDFPKSEMFGLTSQIRRSSASVCANIAEGFRKSTKDFCRYLDIAIGSNQETEYFIILLGDLKYADVEKCVNLMQENIRIGKMLSSLRSKMKARVG